MPPDSKAITLRLAAEQAAALEVVARIDEQTMSDAVREAIDEHIERRRGDKEFIERLRKRHDADRELYERLAR
jgi:predicted DNA-binding protein